MLSVAGVPHEYRFDIEKGSKLYIEGTSNINSFKCKWKDVWDPQIARINVSDDERSIWFTATVLKIKTELLDCDNTKMNRDLCESLKSGTYPYIRIELHDATVVDGTFDDPNTFVQIVCNASITITNVTRRVTLKVKSKRLGPGRYSFLSSKELLMTNFGVDPPVAFMGLVKVRDRIRINFEMTIAGS